MAGYRKTDDGYEWDLTLHPDTAATLLSAVCVDETPGRPNPQWLGHLLWGPKSWSIKFDGPKFRLYPLGRGSFYTLYGLPHGMIEPSKTGSRLTLRGESDRDLYRVVVMVSPVFALLLGFGAFIQLFTTARVMFAVLATVAVAGWVTFVVWLSPCISRATYLDFIDDLFAGHVAPQDAQADQEPEERTSLNKPPTYHAMPPFPGE